MVPPSCVPTPLFDSPNFDLQRGGSRWVPRAATGRIGDPTTVTDRSSPGSAVHATFVLFGFRSRGVRSRRRRSSRLPVAIHEAQPRKASRSLPFVRTKTCRRAGARASRPAMERNGGKPSAPAPAPWRDGAVTYLHLLFYIAISGGQIFFNKWVLSSKEINFPYPVALTLLHMVFSSIVCFAITKVFKIIKIEEGMTTDIYISSVIPIGAMFAMTLWLGNSAYLYISVAFAQMLKAIMPVAVFLLGAAFGLEEMSYKMLGIMSVISVGVIVASVGEITISWVGVVYQMGGVIAEALRLIFIEIFLKKKGVKLNLISMMYYVSPCSAVCLFIPWLLLEKPKMDDSVSWNFPPFTLFLNCMCTFVLNMSVFLVISRTSALTARVTGVVRDWSVVLLSAAIFADTKLTFINIIGYAIAIAGVVAYNNHKLKVKPQVNQQQGEENKANPGSPRDVETSTNFTKEAS